MLSEMRGSRPARIVSIHVKGSPATRPRSTELRLDFMVTIMRAIRRRGWRALDTIVFPAGYLRTADWLAPAPTTLRRAMIDASVGDICVQAVRKLSEGSPGCVIVTGIDTNRFRPWGFRGDQALAAFNQDGCLAVVRKIFPTDGDTNEYGRAPYLLDHEDALTEDRFLPLPNGDIAMLCLCYDSFVFSELALGPTTKLRAMRYKTAVPDGWDDLTPTESWLWLSDLSHRIRTHWPRVLLNPIHGFDAPGREVLWHRHGLACASSFLGGGLAIGAAHYQRTLPTEGFAMLAATRAPPEQLGLANFRTAYTHAPTDSFSVRGSGRRPMNAFIQLHEG